MSAVPAPTGVTIFPDTVATAVLELEKVTESVPPEVDVADTVKAGSSELLRLKGPNVIVLAALAMLKAYVGEVAAL